MNFNPYSLPRKRHQGTTLIDAGWYIQVSANLSPDADKGLGDEAAEPRPGNGYKAN